MYADFNWVRLPLISPRLLPRHGTNVTGVLITKLVSYIHIILHDSVCAYMAEFWHPDLNPAWPQ